MVSEKRILRVTYTRAHHFLTGMSCRASHRSFLHDFNAVPSNKLKSYPRIPISDLTVNAFKNRLETGADAICTTENLLPSVRV